MLLQQERTRLSERKMLKTDISRELYGKYYFTLFEFARDLKNSNVSEISIKDGSVVIRTRKEGVLLNCPEGDTTSALGQLILAGTENIEQEMMTVLLREILKGKEGNSSKAVFFDIGANIGWYSLYFDKLFNDLQIFAFEPVPATYEQFLKNMVLNQSGSIKVNNFGFADLNATVDFYVSPSLLAASSLADTYQTPDKVKVKGEIRRLDDYCQENGIQPDFIKCDVEGAELLVFKGAKKTLSEARPLVMTELLRKWSKCFNYHPNDVIGLFKEKNYSCFLIANGRLQPCESVTDATVETNFFFLHNEKHKQFLEIDLLKTAGVTDIPPQK
ncbi:methyltransferase, FkbM family [Syntrophus gentianae]|uniref:Methyltransferase, FkbM family n=2 Tax=Syntrophus gentianae TaxID=43775 RepID=A0A1H7Z9M7_9BACT|nr:methyltransferase, FkbM family [Syntrophus gentianae]